MTSQFITILKILFINIIQLKGTEMAHRLEFLSEKIKSSPPPYVDSAYDFFQLSSMLTAEENKIRQKVRQFVENEVIPTIDPYVQEATFPEYLVPKMRNLNILHYFFKPPYGLGLSTSALGSLIAELSRGDAGVCTMVLVQWALLGSTIEILGSPEQKEKYIPKIKNFEMIGGWGLTEDKIGSDASNLHTAVTKIADDKYRIHGNKRWIGNGNRDLLIVWAKNTQTKKIEGFIVENKNAPGMTSQVIKYKLPLRIVQNCHITLNNVVVSADQKLPKAKDFATGVNVILRHSRIFVCWVAAGIAMGVYDNVIKYVSNRKQFGQPISGFQLVQQKLVRIMANTQGIFLMCYRVSKLIDDGKATMGQIAMTKAWVTERAREVAKLGRQLLGGNGITHENYVMKAMADMEAIYTYEGTYDINSLVAGRQLTGLSAFK